MADNCHGCGKHRYQSFKTYLGKCLVCRYEFCIDCLSGEKIAKEHWQDDPKEYALLYRAIDLASNL
jgi:hypothetical protein